MPADSSTILTFLRNATGGFGTSVDPASYTTFRRDYDFNSLSITTESVAEESYTSGRTPVILTEAGSFPWIYNSIVQGLTTFIIGGSNPEPPA